MLNTFFPKEKGEKGRIKIVVSTQIQNRSFKIAYVRNTQILEKRGFKKPSLALDSKGHNQKNTK